MRLHLLVLLAVIFTTVKAQTPTKPYTFPEYTPVSGVYVEWDFNNNTWPLYSDMIEKLGMATKVYCIVINAQEQADMTNRLTQDGVELDSVYFIQTPAYRMWIRDHGPISIADSNNIAYVDLNDLANSGVDENLPTRLAEYYSYNSYSLPITLCGGNFMVDSKQSLFCTKRLYSSNPSYTKAEIDSMLKNVLGIKRIITFQSQADDYWGHIDMQMKLLNDTTVILSHVAPGSANYDSLQANFAVLDTLTSPTGNPYTIARIRHAENWKTYANSLILNNHVFIPVYENVLDSVAINTYQSLLPNHTIVGVNCNSIIGWDGALHCITMQRPKYIIPDTTVTTNVSTNITPEFGFSVFPNPAKQNQTLSIKLDSPFNAKTLSFYNSLGALVLQMPYTETITLPNIAKGLYNIILSDGKLAVGRALVVD